MGLAEYAAFHAGRALLPPKSGDTVEDVVVRFTWKADATVDIDLSGLTSKQLSALLDYCGQTSLSIDLSGADPQDLAHLVRVLAEADGGH